MKRQAENNKTATKDLVQRLCSEIQLFDLCALSRCSFIEGRFCTNKELLKKFEDISEDDAVQKVEPYIVDEDDEFSDNEELDEDGYDNEYDDDYSNDYNDIEDDE